MAKSLPFKTIQWIGGIDGHLELIDQTVLPNELKYVACHDVGTLWEAIRCLSVRGAPAIGVAAAMGVVLAVREAQDAKKLFDKLDWACEYLGGSRPTAVNLFWALERMRSLGRSLTDSDVDDAKEALLAEARLIQEEDAAMCEAIGEAG